MLRRGSLTLVPPPCQTWGSSGTWHPLRGSPGHLAMAHGAGTVPHFALEGGGP